MHQIAIATEAPIAAFLVTASRPVSSLLPPNGSLRDGDVIGGYRPSCVGPQIIPKCLHGLPQQQRWLWLGHRHSTCVRRAMGASKTPHCIALAPHSPCLLRPLSQRHTRGTNIPLHGIIVARHGTRFLLGIAPPSPRWCGRYLPVRHAVPPCRNKAHECRLVQFRQ